MPGYLCANAHKCVKYYICTSHWTYEFEQGPCSACADQSDDRGACSASADQSDDRGACSASADQSDDRGALQCLCRPIR
ncbi:hypothetical protein COCON_G00130210 [Conger conger]|uniref:Uncharacterized protein n=1 Tax=Conger conger TaxID=82655 RepID=A0A9Q1HXE2_CONCO|nr:hypothetical protein COCON_G00130210 [Conger conger]